MKQIVNPDFVAKPVGHYSQGVLASGSRLLFIAGQVSVDEYGRVVGTGDIEAQTRQIMKNIEAIVRAAGGTMDDIVELTIYDTDVDSHGEISRKVRDEFLGSDFPAGTRLEVKRLVHPDYLIEISAIAVLD